MPSCGILGVRGCPRGKTPGRSPGKGNGCLQLAGRVQFVLRGPNIGMRKTVVEAAEAGSIVAQPLLAAQRLREICTSADARSNSLSRSA